MFIKLVLSLLLVPGLCLANLGDTEKELQQRYASPGESEIISRRAKACTFTNNQVVVVVGLLDGRSVAELFYDKDGAPVSQKKLTELIALYGNKWYPVPDKGSSRTVRNMDNTIEISYGFISMTDSPALRNSVLVTHINAAEWLIESKGHLLNL